ncbi:hypothetical protein AB0F20_24115 [Streptomyces goshikiensis]|uniref:hypothetical protein n=1 Tax=Streptomyces goshikiensis TaxID=1942 RepID=UPI0033D7462D
MKNSMSKAAGAVLGLALAGVLGATGVAQAQALPSVPAPAPAGTAVEGPSAVRAPASVIAQVEAATARQHAFAPNARVVCYSAHVQDIGWQAAVCDGQVAGTTGQGRRMEAVVIATRGVGGVCANAHLAEVGWQGWACAGEGAAVTVGTTGQSRRMEALGVQVGSGGVAAQAHIANYGWLNSAAGNPVYVGSTGQSLQMEAVRIWA